MWYNIIKQLLYFYPKGDDVMSGTVIEAISAFSGTAAMSAFAVSGAAVALLIILFIAASVVSGILTFRARMKKLRSESPPSETDKEVSP